MPGMIYYGRYVDDLLMVVDRTVKKGESSSEVLEDVFVKSNVFVTSTIWAVKYK